MKFYTREEAANILSVTVHSLDRYIREGVHGRKLKVHRIGGIGSPRIEESDLRAFMGMQPREEAPDPVDVPIDVLAERVIRECGYQAGKKRHSPAARR